MRPRDWPTDARDIVGDAVELHLTYKGPLPSTKDRRKRALARTEIRCQLSTQLEQCWKTTPILRDSLSLLEPATVKGDRMVIISGLLGPWVVRFAGVEFIPLVIRPKGMSCHLNIKLLCPQGPGAIVHGGDIDNRLKTLFDGLRMPHKDEEVGNIPTGHRIFSLLEDDALITKLSVRAAKLLDPIEPGKESHVRLEMEVITKTDEIESRYERVD
jgi:hypothetical protein